MSASVDVLMQRVTITEAGCWEWKLSRSGRPGRRYGRWRVDGREQRAHRVAYELLVGPIPDGHELHHSCHNPPCCNPAHLELLTLGEHHRLHPNQNSAKTHCIRGHELNGDNLRLRLRDGRVVRGCRACQAEHARGWKEAHC